MHGGCLLDMYRSNVKNEGGEDVNSGGHTCIIGSL